VPASLFCGRFGLSTTEVRPCKGILKGFS
jgi:hypothetical protein